MTSQAWDPQGPDDCIWPAGVSVWLAAVPESVPELRAELRRFLANLEVDRLRAHEVEVAAVEAATNVVQHAYAPGEAGSLELETDYELGSVEMVVRDHGWGIQPGSSDQLGLGLQMIAALTDDFAITEVTGGGIEVWMRFLCPVLAGGVIVDPGG